MYKFLNKRIGGSKPLDRGSGGKAYGGHGGQTKGATVREKSVGKVGVDISLRECRIIETLQGATERCKFIAGEF